MKTEVEKTVVSYPFYRKRGGHIWYKIVSAKQMIKVEDFAYYSKAIEFYPLVDLALSDGTKESTKKEFDMAYADVMRYFKSLEITYE